MKYDFSEINRNYKQTLTTTSSNWTELFWNCHQIENLCILYGWNMTVGTRHAGCIQRTHAPFRPKRETYFPSFIYYENKVIEKIILKEEDGKLASNYCLTWKTVIRTEIEFINFGPFTRRIHRHLCVEQIFVIQISNMIKGLWLNADWACVSGILQSAHILSEKNEAEFHFSRS